jgi:hypothetical protein
MEVALCVGVCFVLVILSLKVGMLLNSKLTDPDSKPPSWGLIVTALGENINIANKRIAALEEKIEQLHLEHIQCQKTNAVLLSKVEYLERQGV